MFSKNKNKNINIKDLTFPVFQYFVVRELNTNISLVSNANQDNISIHVTPGHGFVPGNLITMFNNSVFEQANVISVLGDIVTIDTPLSFSFPVAGTKVVRGSKKMNINGSITPVTFAYKPYNSFLPIIIKSVIIKMYHGVTQGDDGKFGGIAALTNGIYFRQVDDNRRNFGNYKNNGDFRDRKARVEYISKAPAGTEATIITFGIQDSFGQVIKINPLLNEYLIAVVRDNLTTLTDFTISLIGCICRS